MNKSPTLKILIQFGLGEGDSLGGLSIPITKLYKIRKEVPSSFILGGNPGRTRTSSGAIDSLSLGGKLSMGSKILKRGRYSLASKLYDYLAALILGFVKTLTSIRGITTSEAKKGCSMPDDSSTPPRLLRLKEEPPLLDMLCETG